MYAREGGFLCLACAPITGALFNLPGRFGVPGVVALAPENGTFIANTPALAPREAQIHNQMFPGALRGDLLYFSFIHVP